MLAYMSSDAKHEELDQLRKEIDVLDQRFLTDFADFIRERLQIVNKIGEYKRKANLNIHDQKREDEVLRDRIERGEGKGLSGVMIRQIWQALIEYSKARE